MFLSIFRRRLWLMLLSGLVGGLGCVGGTILEEARLTDGTHLTGRLEVTGRGLFEATEHGGRQHAWAEIDPQSLPVGVREQLREQLRERLRRAQTHYEAKRVLQAQPLFQQVYAMRHYLTAEDRRLPAFQQIQHKRRGEVFFNQTWMPFARRQELLGFAYYRGKWIPREQAEELHAFEAVFAKADETRHPFQLALELERVMNDYPDSVYLELAEKLKEKLLERAEQEPKLVVDDRDRPREAEKKKERQSMIIRYQPRPRREPRFQADDYDRFDDWYDDYDHHGRDYCDFYPPKLVFRNGKLVTVIPSTPKRPCLYGYRRSFHGFHGTIRERRRVIEPPTFTIRF